MVSRCRPNPKWTTLMDMLTEMGHSVPLMLWHVLKWHEVETKIIGDRHFDMIYIYIPASLLPQTKYIPASLLPQKIAVSRGQVVVWTGKVAFSIWQANWRKCSTCKSAVAVSPQKRHLDGTVEKKMLLSKQQKMHPPESHMGVTT